MEGDVGEVEAAHVGADQLLRVCGGGRGKLDGVDYRAAGPEMGEPFIGQLGGGSWRGHRARRVTARAGRDGREVWRGWIRGMDCMCKVEGQ